MGKYKLNPTIPASTSAAASAPQLNVIGHDHTENRINDLVHFIMPKALVTTGKVIFKGLPLLPVIASAYAIASRSINKEASYYTDTLPEIAALFMMGYDIVDTLAQAAKCAKLRGKIKEKLVELRMDSLALANLKHYNPSFERPPLFESLSAFKQNTWDDPFIKEIIFKGIAFMGMLGFLLWQFPSIKLINEDHNKESANIQLTVSDVAALLVVIAYFFGDNYSGIKAKQAEVLADLEAVDMALSCIQDPTTISRFINHHLPQNIKDQIILDIGSENENNAVLPSAAAAAAVTAESVPQSSPEELMTHNDINDFAGQE
jgi:hypothetical protein